MRSQTGKSIFLLGAGASVDAGLPTIEQLMPRFESLLQRLASRNPHPLALWKRLRRAIERNDEQLANIETTFQLLYHLRSRALHPLSSIVERWEKWVRDIDMDRVTGELLGHLQPFLLSELGTPKNVDYLAPLLGLEWEEGVDVFTLNYDLSLEMIARQIGRVFTTGFMGAPLGSDRIRVWNPEAFDGAGIRIYKLHGSLNWTTHNDPSCTVLCEMDFRGYQEMLHSIRQYPTELLSWHSLVEEIWFPPFIFGLPGKLHPGAPFAWLFARFTEALRRACSVVVIGYGWQDTHVNHALRWAVQNGVRIVNVNPSTSLPALHVLGTGFPAEAFFLQSTAAQFLCGERCEAVVQGGHPDPWRTTELVLEGDVLAQVLEHANR